jgi:hypothetical protein
MFQLYKHNDTYYKILRDMPSHNFMDKKGVVQMEILKAWRDWLGADHVLRIQDRYLMCETIPEIDFEEIVYTDVNN